MNRSRQWKPIKGRSAFTLLELLVSVLIVAGLVVLILPAFKKAMEKAKSVRCANCLRLYGSQAMLYAADNDGAIAAFNSDGEGFQRFLPSYPDVTDNDLVGCPAFAAHRSALTGIPVPKPLKIAWTGHNTNRYFGDRSGKSGDEKDNNYKNPGRISQVTQPAKTPLYFDVDMTLPNTDAYGRYVKDGAAASMFWSAHSGAFNIVFMDGHVESVRFNREGPGGGASPQDYPQFIWKPY